MSTPDQPDTPPLTRRQMREIRNTGSTPVIPPAEQAETPEPPAPAPAPTPAPLPRAAEPAPVAPAPVAPDLGVAPLTRRQARQQERIRTASVPVITPDLLLDQPAGVITAVPAREVTQTPPADEPRADEPHGDEPRADEPQGDEPRADEPQGDEPRADEPRGESEDVADDTSATGGAPAAADERVTAAEVSDAPEDESPALQVNPALGSELLGGEVPAATLPPSFDQLIARGGSTTGSIAAPNALILSQTPAGAPLVAPVTATGEVLITGTFELPDGLGSIGHAHGAADGKDLDVALIDGELPAASSPTPIAASAAISTVRNSGEEIIRPPAPEKGGRLMLALVITAGVLALALAGVLIVALTTGRI